MAEKTEKPTDKKIRDSAKKGQSFKGKDMTAALVLVVGVFTVGSFSGLYNLGLFFQKVLLSPEEMLISAYLREMYRFFLYAVIPVLLACFLSGAGIALLQSRFRLATKAIKIDFSSLNPVQGFKKIFSLKTIKELVKAFLYLGVFCVSAASFFVFWGGEIFSLYKAELSQVIYQWRELSLKFVAFFLFVALIVLVLDTMTEFFLFIKQLKMDKQEVKKEFKDNEGDPHIKNERKKLHRDLISEEVKTTVRSSKFVMANPTHIAMAIFYDPELAPLPCILLKLRGSQARAVIAFAEKEGIPVIRDIALARSLWRQYKRESFIDDNGLGEVMRIINWLQCVELARLGVNVDELMRGMGLDDLNIHATH